jgi:hypothetical protein
MLARIRHRNVVDVYGAQQIGHEIGLWMELIRGRHLADFVRQEGAMGPEEATLVAPIFYAVVTLLSVRATVAVWRIGGNAVPPLARVERAFRSLGALQLRYIGNVVPGGFDAEDFGARPGSFHTGTEFLSTLAVIIRPF